MMLACTKAIDMLYGQSGKCILISDAALPGYNNPKAQEGTNTKSQEGTSINTQKSVE
jgi:hypothetical protein